MRSPERVKRQRSTERRTGREVEEQSGREVERMGRVEVMMVAVERVEFPPQLNGT